MAGTAYAQKNVVQPGDPVIASSANSPGSEGVANAIDGTQAKYLNRDSANDAKPSGFVVTPSVGVTWVTGIAMESANDAPDRDPKAITLEGSNDATIADFSSGTWELIYSNTNVPAWTDVFPGGNNVDRYQWQTFTFSNFKAYKHYRWTVLNTQGTAGVPTTCCMQIAEVQLLGSLLPKNVVQPGDPLVASSANSPGSEGVANAIDGTQAKYLNRDSANDAKPSGFIVTPSAGATLVQGISMESANDAPDRDPKSITLEGSNDDAVSDFGSGTWEVIYSNPAIPAWTDVFPGGSNVDRYQWQTFLFDNVKPFKHYRWTLVKTQGTAGVPSTCCMQIAEVQLLGYPAPKNVLQPGDQIFASSANSPGSEGVANAIDGTQAKYLNRDSANDAKPSGFAVTPSVGDTTIIGVGMESANDAPDRDPKSITIEGSNDDTISDYTTGTWEVIYSNDAIPAWTDVYPGGNNVDRYKWQYFYFSNKKSYKHYRWTLVKTQGTAGVPSTCCMQIAEVQLLAVTSANDCSKAAFLLQPENTPVLEGSQATFFTTVNGPYTLQWATNGVAVPGASASSYTTPPITTADSNIVYTVQIVGCQTSTPVYAVIFTPSATKSIAINFSGGGANGAPSFLAPDDIVGVQPQAYWNNATNHTDATDNIFSGSTGDGNSLPDTLVDSDGKTSTITFEYACSGRWGSGTGTDSATQRMLNGQVGAAGTGTAQTLTFHNVPAGSHSVLIYAVAPPLHQQQVSYNIGSQTYYLKVMNSDEYKPAPGFYRGTSTDSNNPSIADFVRFDNVHPDASGDVLLTFNILVAGQQSTGVNGIQLVLNAPAVGAPPGIGQNPQTTVGPANGTVQLTVVATGDNLTYQWRKSGRNLPNSDHVSGATTATLTLTSLSADDEGVYSVAVFNPAGSVVSKNARVTISKYDIQDALVGYWKLDETSGATAANSATGGKPGTVTGTAAWAKGQIDNALTFDGGSTYVQVPSYTLAKKAISAAAWVNVAAGTGTDVAFMRNAQGAIGVGVAQDSYAGQFEIGLVADTTTGISQLSAAVGAGPNIIRATAPAAFPMGSWHHVAFAADGSQLNLYIDGVLVASRDYNDADLNVPEIPYISIGARLALDTSDPPVLGADFANPNYMAGPMDDIGLWTRALTADEVSKIYTAGKAGQALTTVVETPPAGAPTLTWQRSADGLSITFTGTLQSVETITGQWTDVAGATSPYPVSASGAQKYFRAKQ